MVDKMTSEAARRAAELANAECRGDQFVSSTFCGGVYPERKAFVKFIQHVSDVAERVERINESNGWYGPDTIAKLQDDFRALILPKPVDPLVEVWASTLNSPNGIRNLDAFRAELAKRGGRVVFDGGE